MILDFSECQLAPNIAIIKYWGKAHEQLIIPLFNSISITLDSDDLCSSTKVELIKIENQQDSITELILNNKQEQISSRIQQMCTIFRQKYKKNVNNEKDNKNNNDNEQNHKNKSDINNDNNVNNQDYKIRITSHNNFPTESGLASSSSGLSALAVCFCKLLKTQKPEFLMELCRMGSGSSIRSIYGGLVEWQGIMTDPKHLQYLNSINLINNNQIKTIEHFDTLITNLNQPQYFQQIQQYSYHHFTCQQLNIINSNDLLMLILCSNFQSKKVPSTQGMLQSVKNSNLLKLKAMNYQSQQTQINQLKSCFQSKQINYSKLFEISMRESKELHGICLSTEPSLQYLDEFSYKIIQWVEFIRSYLGNDSIGYTFDAGPHPILLINPNHYYLINLFQSLYPIARANHKFIQFNKDHPECYDEVLMPIRQQWCLLNLNLFIPSYIILTNPGTNNHI